MSINDVGMLFSFIGGLGMFLYGMNIMADGLQKSAGGKMAGRKRGRGVSKTRMGGTWSIPGSGRIERCVDSR